LKFSQVNFLGESLRLRGYYITNLQLTQYKLVSSNYVICCDG
jgi:hypothetical protein